MKIKINVAALVFMLCLFMGQCSIHGRAADGAAAPEAGAITGKVADGKGDKEDTKVELAPKVMVESCDFSKKKIYCGKKFTADITLYNTSRTDAARNMMITVQPGENVELLGKTGSSYIRMLGAGKRRKVSFSFRILPTAPRGQYNIDVNLDYADSRGNSYTVQEAVKVSARQKVRIDITPVSVPKSIQLGETVQIQVQVANLGKGKLYGVRAVLEGEGLAPSGQAFIGDMEGGTAMMGDMELTAEGLSGDTLYGTARGKIIFRYEDEMGHKKKDEQEFETTILPMPSGDADDEGVDDTGQWWVIMTAIGTIIAVSAVMICLRRLRRHDGKKHFS